jgi:hypothetical protein
VRIKDAGERMAHFRLFGIPVLRPFCGPVISLGCTIRESVSNYPIKRNPRWLRRPMKKDAIFIIDNLDRFCAKHGGDCKSCPIMDGCKSFIALLASMPFSIRNAERMEKGTRLKDSVMHCPIGDL